MSVVLPALEWVWEAPAVLTAGRVAVLVGPVEKVWEMVREAMVLVVLQR